MNDFAVRMDSDSSASLAGFVFGITATLAAWWRFGVEWLPAAMLFFPVRGLVDGLVSNASGKIVKHGFVLILYPVAVQTALLAASYLQQNIPAQGTGADKPELQRHASALERRLSRPHIWQPRWSPAFSMASRCHERYMPSSAPR